MAENKQDNNLKPRPPIVVVMGHVDHGKTTLLDYIRKTNIATKEAGGITQAVGAYEIIHGGKKITFIDTPGHEAFSKMRSRGAVIADLAILVVAADEGVKAQTEEAIKILNETKTPFIVAITRIDKPAANVEKVKNELLNASVLLEGMGGQVSYQPISSKSGEGINELLDLILLSAELENLTYDSSAKAGGYVLETKVDSRRGLEAAVILKNGILRRCDPIATKTANGRIKILENFLGETAEELEPSAPALIIGFETLPLIGEEFVIDESASDASCPPITEALKQISSDSDKDYLKLILKATDSGSLEALSEIVKSLKAEKPIQIVGESVGEIMENDVKMAISAKASIIGFKSRSPKGFENMILNHNIRIITSPIIYELVKKIEELILESAKPVSAGELEVLAVFNQKKPEKQLIGGKITGGTFKNRAEFEIQRNNEVIGQGRILNLQQGKKDVSRVDADNEAGLLVNSKIIINIGYKLIVN